MALRVQKPNRAPVCIVSLPYNFRICDDLVGVTETDAALRVVCVDGGTSLPVVQCHIDFCCVVEAFKEQAFNFGFAKDALVVGAV